MNKMIKLHLIYSMVMMLVFYAVAFAQDTKVNVNKSKVDVAGPDGSVNINADSVKVKSSESGSVNVQSNVGGSDTSGSLNFTEDATISGRNIVSDKNGITLKGEGDYVLVDCKITAGKNAVVVADNATVTMKNCVINGGHAAILITDNGTLKASGNVINGKIKKQGNADYVDQGSNVINNL